MTITKFYMFIQCKNRKCFGVNQLLFLLISVAWLYSGAVNAKNSHVPSSLEKPMHCLAFSPYVDNLSPDYGAQPSKQLLGKLLDHVLKQTPFRCIMTYGVLGGLEDIFYEAQQRNIKVIAILWIDNDPIVNTQSISKGIYLAREFKDTIIKVSCGSEVRTRRDYAYDKEITRCLNALREAKISQAISTIDTWWEWCNRSVSCQKTAFSEQVDWIGINIFPWWENIYSSLHDCVSAEHAADFHLARLEQVQRANPGKEVIITEFGWPANTTAQTGGGAGSCATASLQNQALVVQSTLKKLAQKKVTGVVFEAFSEQWKAEKEGDSGKFWGICEGVAPYACNKYLNFGK